MYRDRVMHRRAGKTCRFIVGWIVLLLLGLAPPSEGDILRVDDPVSAAGLIVDAMDIPDACSCIKSREDEEKCDVLPEGCPSFSTTGNSALRGKGIADEPVGFIFPREGGTFAILSTGVVGSADNPNNSTKTSEALGRLNNEQGKDLVELYLTLRPPSDAVCLAFDYAFYTEEYPEYFGPPGRGKYPGARNDNLDYDDVFTATIGTGQALETFASDSVSTLDFSGSTGTTYDGVAGPFTAVARLRPGDRPVAYVVLSIEDITDAIYDSAVFLDNFRWLTDPGCEVDDIEPPLDDTDEDGLPDDWEENGVDVDEDGAIDLDLPALGANPLRKDIFLEIDFMAEEERCVFNVCQAVGHNHGPEREALERVIEAFARAPVDNPDGTTGIRLHIDAGPESFFDLPSREKWGVRSQSDLLEHVDDLGSFSDEIYDWSAFDEIKDEHFAEERRPVFHYAIFAHGLGGSDDSGRSRGIPGSDFLVSLGDFAKRVGSVRQQAGTLMHELGHNLGLDDGGGDRTLFKPNYLSVMNPFFQMRGLRYRENNGRLDYSFEELFSLDEEALDESRESNGLDGSEDLDPYGTRYFCPSGIVRTVDHVNNPINWNCDGRLEQEDTVVANVNGLNGLEFLDGFNDWENIQFDGGLIGKLGEDDEDDDTDEIDPDDEGDLDDGGEEEAAREIPGIGALEDALIPTDFDVLVTGISRVAQLAGTTQVYSFQVTNVGENADTYNLAATSDLGWANLTTVPAQVSLARNQSAAVTIAVTIPAGTPINTEDEVTLGAASVANDLLLDSATTSPYVPENPPVANAGPDQRVECSSQNGTPVTLDGSASQAPSGGVLVYQWAGPFPEGGGKVSGVRPTVTLPLGLSTITLRVNDGIVDSYPDTVVVNVVDTIPPVISATLSPNSLWPANHTMQPIRATVIATDICTPPTVALTFITSSEPDDAKGNGDGNTTNDIQGAAIGTPDFLFSLRAERAGSGPGRVYTTRYTARDSSGNQAWDDDQVRVPHSQKK